MPEEIKSFSQRITLTITLEDLDAMRSRIAAADEHIHRLEAELVAASTRDASGLVPQLLDVIATVIPIVQFAVGNLDPATVRGWPHQLLDSFGEKLLTMPGTTDALKEFALELRVFARQAVEYERMRIARDALPPNVASAAAAELSSAMQASAAKPS